MFLKDLSSSLAATTGKPEMYMVVQVIPDVHMMFGGTDEPCANGFFMCIGKMGPEENKIHAANLYPVICKHLNIQEDRMYILFSDVPTSDVAWKSTTFQTILDGTRTGTIQEHYDIIVLLARGDPSQ